MEDVKAVIRSGLAEAMCEERHDGPSAEAAYFFPSFPPCPANHQTKPFAQWQPQGVYLAVRSSSTQHNRDSHGLTFASGQSVDTNAPEASEERAKERKLRQLEKGKLGVRVLKEDCFKIGLPDSGWTEPEGTSRSDYDISLPPFTRLMSATRDFLNSRNEEFQFNRTKRLMDSVRNAFGVRAEIPGQHCKGSGEFGVNYQPPSSLMNRRRKAKLPQQKTLIEQPDAEEETCPLLRDPVTSVRGFMALVRRDAEAGWDIAPALQLATFICFVEHHNAVPELAEAFAKAAQLARSAINSLAEAKMFEDIIGRGTNLNRALWAVYGGQWQGPERGGLELEPASETTPVVEETGSDGGWEVEQIPDLRPSPPNAEDARKSLEPHLQPLDPKSVKMLGYIPFSRRKVISVSPPSSQLSPGEPTFKGQLGRLVTVAAPWTVEERWRARASAVESDDDGEESDEESDGFELEKEKANINEPKELEIWYEADQFEGDQSCLVGVGLRGRWALMGAEDGPRWWSFKAKDFVLPAFWQS